MRNQQRGAMVVALAVIGAFLGSGQAVAEQTQIVEAGQHLLFGDLSQVGSLGLYFRDDGTGTPAEFEITGDSVAKNRIDGRNHDLNGNLVGSGDRPGVTLDVDDTSLNVDGNETITGVSAVQDNADAVDVPAYVNALLRNADVTYTSATTLNNDTIGGPTDYKIVVVKDAKLTLKGSTTGYGVLVVCDTSPGNGQGSLEMQDTAAWYGVIITYTGDSPGNSDKVKLSFGNTPHDGAPGTGVRVFGSIVSMGRQVGIDFPHKSVADLYYSAAAVGNVDQMLQARQFTWSDWRER